MGIFSRKPPDGPAVAHVVQSNDQAVYALDQALGAFGPVTHSYSPGGLPIRSVGIVEVAHPRPYTLLVTYGFSEVLAPEPHRQGFRHEFSLAIPRGEPVAPWADAFLRAQAYSMLEQRADVRPGECIPFNGVPMTYMPFQPEHHAMMPPTTLVGMFVAADPVLPMVNTPAGPVEIRRLVGIDQYEIDRAITWDPPAFLELMRGLDPLLLSSLQRPSYLQQAAFREAVELRASREGSSVESLLLDFVWQTFPGTLRIQLPQGPAMVRALNALRVRIGLGNELFGLSRGGAPIAFVPGAPGMTITRDLAELAGDLSTPPIAIIVAALEQGAAYVDLPMLAPPPGRARQAFFAKVSAMIHEAELKQTLSKEVGKLLDEARAIAVLADQVPETERDADRAACSAVIRTLRFARSTDQSTIQPMIEILSQSV
ncbi:hypothetical protein BH11MYX1_BH11MYX1_51000 [soil metagenome]